MYAMAQVAIHDALNANRPPLSAVRRSTWSQSRRRVAIRGGGGSRA